MCKTCGCNMSNPKEPGYGKGKKDAKKGADKKAPAKKK